MKFYHGTHYYTHISSRDKFIENFEKMNKIGINLIKTAEVFPGWEVFEKQEGVYDWDELEYLINTAANYNMEIMLGVGVNNPPPWIFEKYKDVRQHFSDGSISHRRLHSACHDHAGFRMEMERFTREFVSHFSGFDNIMGWQYTNEARYNGKCVCRHTSERFREWLKNIYNRDLDALNEKWTTYFCDWDQIWAYQSPEGFPTYGVQAIYMDYMRFLAWSITDLISTGAKIIREYSTKPVTHNTYSFMQNFWDIAKAVDIHGTDIYVSQERDKRTRNLWGIGLVKASAGSKDFMILETSAGQYGTYRRDYIDPDILFLLTLEYIAAGAKGLLYFRWIPPSVEQPHKFSGSQALLKYDGSCTPYIKIPEKISAIMEKYGPIFTKARTKQTEIGVYFSYDSINISREAEMIDIQTSVYKDALGIFADVQLDATYISDISIDENVLDKIKVLYMPLSLSVKKSSAEKIKKWVLDGGIIICEPRVGYVDEYAKLYLKVPGGGLHEIFGAYEDIYYDCDRNDVWIYLDGRCYEISTPIIRSEIGTEGRCEVIGRYDNGSIFAVRSIFGKGSGILLGGSFSLMRGKGEYISEVETLKGSFINKNSFQDLPYDRNIIYHLLRETGYTVNRTVYASSGNVTVRELVGTDENYIFVLNMSAERVELSICDNVEMIDGEGYVNGNRGIVGEKGYLILKQTRRE